MSDPIHIDSKQGSAPRSQASSESASPTKRKYTRRFKCREGCGSIVEAKDDICPGCDAYREHTGAF